MKVLKSVRGDGQRGYTYFCDECMAELDQSIMGGMWNLSCGHHLCAECDTYSSRFNLKIHRDRCPDWKLGAVDDDEDKVTAAQTHLKQQGFSIGGHPI